MESKPILNNQSLKQDEFEKLKKNYIALQKDYTKKCQLLKTYTKNADKAVDNNLPTAPAMSVDNLNDDTFIKEHILTNPKIVELIIRDYINKLRNGGNPVLITSQGEVKSCETVKPRTISEAGEYALKYLNKR